MTGAALELYLIHGRDTAERELEDWGPDGPRLQGVIGLHQTYGNGARVVFASRAAKEAARELTGWESVDDDTLQMRWEDDLVAIAGVVAPRHVFAEGEEPAPVRLYGDWGLMVPAA